QNPTTLTRLGSSIQRQGARRKGSILRRTRVNQMDRARPSDKDTVRVRTDRHWQPLRGGSDGLTRRSGGAQPPSGGKTTPEQEDRQRKVDSTECRTPHRQSETLREEADGKTRRSIPGEQQPASFASGRVHDRPEKRDDHPRTTTPLCASPGRSHSHS